MSNIKGEIKEEKDRRQQMQDSVNDFVSDFYEKFGFKPIVAFEDINSIKLKGLIRERHNITLEDLEEICNSFIDLDKYPGGIRNRSRKNQIVTMRHLYMYFGYKFDFTLHKIANQIGYDHAMVVHAKNTVSDRIDVNDRPYIRMYAEVKNAIEKKTGPTDFL